MRTRRERRRDRRRGERQSAHREALFAQAIDGSRDMISITDPQNRFVFVNEAFIAAYGYDRAEVLGKEPAFIGGSVSPELGQLIWEGTRAGGWSGELLNRRRDGTELPVALTTSIVRDDRGGILGYLGVARDVSEARRVADELREAREQALAASRAKSEFLASMSHEIRTPMNGVIGMAGLLLDTELGPQSREFAETIRRSAESLLTVINDILDFSKIEAGKLAIEPVPFDLPSVLADALELLAAEARDKGLELVLRCAPEAPRQVVGDPGRIRQVLVNLVGNAVKFTPEGHVLVDLACERGDEQQAHLRITVEDTGIGIPADKLARIFDPFSQADSSTTRRYGGTGLGLAITKKLVELMGGSIRVSSEPAWGSKFSVTLPLPVLDETEAVPAITGLRGVRALVVDDSALSRRVLEEQLSSWEMRTGSAASGTAALVALREAQAQGDPFQVTLVDQLAPGMGAEDLLPALAADPGLSGIVRLLLTPADPRRPASSAVDFAAVLTKPVRPSRLQEALVAAWGTRGKGRVAVARPTPAATPPVAPGAGLGHPPRTLVVEDNVVNQRVSALMLEKLGCRVDVAANGREAVEMIAALPYDLVLMDCEMPEMDGFEAATEIRRREAGARRLPIVAMTAHALQGARERCLLAGMDDYLAKPVSAEQLESVLRRWLDTPGPAAPPADAAPPAPASPVLPSETLDPATVGRLRDLARVAGAGFLSGLLEAFLVQAAESSRALWIAVLDGDRERVRRQAHRLRGSSLNLGATALASLCRELEQEAGVEAPGTGFQRLRRLDAELTRVGREAPLAFGGTA